MADILHRIGVKDASADDVYAALTTRDGLAGWWTTRTMGDQGSEVGERVTFRFVARGEDVGGFDMKVLELVPAKLVLWEVVDGPPEWIGTTVRFELVQEDGWTIVLFKHEGWREQVEFMNHCSTKWATYLLSLKSLVEDGVGAPNPDELLVSNWP